MEVFKVECVLAVVAFVLLWGLHWTRWVMVIPALTGDDGELTLVWRYVVGVGGILLVFVAWAALVPVRTVSPWRAAAFLTADVVAAGLGTLLPRICRMRWLVTVLKEDKADREQALQEGE